MSRNSGFTLLELIVVIAILSILSGLLWNNFMSSLIKGRDSKRKQDLNAISSAIELYYYDFKSYPTVMPGKGTPFLNPSVTGIIYHQQMPADPLDPRSTYCYSTDSDMSYYQFYANLENENDPQIIPTVACNGVFYNYGVSSTNITP